MHPFVHFVYTNDGYAAMYADGKLVLESYDLDENEILNAVGIDSTWAYVDEAWFRDNYFPEKYEDVKLEKTQ